MSLTNRNFLPRGGTSFDIQLTFTNTNQTWLYCASYPRRTNLYRINFYISQIGRNTVVDASFDVGSPNGLFYDHHYLPAGINPDVSSIYRYYCHPVVNATLNIQVQLNLPNRALIELALVSFPNSR